MPASPKLVKVVQADGSTLSVRLNGDEHFNWTTTEDGYTVVEKEGFYYYANYKTNGSYTMSDQRVMIDGKKINPTTDIKKADMGFIASSAAAISRIQKSSDNNILDTGFPSEGDIKAVVILVEYTNVKFTVSDPKTAFNNQLNEEGYSVEGAVGSARDYFYENSGGKFNGQFDVYGPYTLSQTQSYYGGNSSAGSDMRPREMIEEAASLADKDGVDFSQYDFNNDGQIDNVFVYYAGRSEAEGGGSDCVWPHKWEVLNKPTFDGKTLNVYACTSELRGSSAEDPIITGIGTFCHEFSHVFGLADHYDTTGSVDGTSYGLGSYDLMTLGGYNNDGNSPPLLNALERMMIGWVEPEELDSVEDITLGPINRGQTYKMSTDVEGEFFLFENRSRTYSVWDNYIPGEGLLITHVDQSDPYLSYWQNNYPNGDLSHECFKLLVAGNVNVDYYDGWDKAPYPYVDASVAANNNNEWSPNSQPRSEAWSGELMKLQITDIAKSGENITFKVSEATINPISGTVKDSYGSYVAGASLSLASQTGGSTFLGETNQDGVMKFNDDVIPNDTYTLTVSATGYATYTNTFDLVQGYVVDVTLYSEEQGSMREIMYHNGEFDHAIGSLYQIRPMVIFTADQLKEHIGCIIKEVRYYAAAPFEGQVIIQTGLYGAGWSPGSFEVTDAELGWRSADFSGLDSTNGDIIVQPNTDYYVKIMVMTDTEANPAIGMDSSTDYEWYSLSSMLDNQSTDPESIYDNCGVDGNLLVTLALSAESTYVAPTEFIMNPAYTDGITINENEILEIVWGTSPANGNPACNWVSSDESIVYVNTSGTIMGISEGSATVTGTSVLDSSIKMVYTVNVITSEARAIGRVATLKEDEPVSDITLQFYPVQTALPTPQPNAVAALHSDDVTEVSVIDINRFTTSRVDSNNVLTATSGSDGSYSIEGLAAGSKYLIVLEQDVYNDPWTSRSQTTSNAMVAYDPEDPEGTTNVLSVFSLLSNSVYGAEPFRYFEGTPEINSVGDASSAIMYAICMPASELTEKIGYEITHAEVFTYNMADPYMEIIVFALDQNGELVYQGGTAQGEIDTVGNSGQLIVEFINQDPIIVRPDTDYYLTVKMMGEIGAQTSSSNANDGYSNLVWDDNQDKFVSINELGYSGNYDWQMSMFTKYREIDPVNSITVSLADYTIEPCVGRELELVASTEPSTATYNSVTWSSSDDSIATIDEYGTVNLLAAGTVTFTATSVEYPDIKGDYTLSVELKQGTEGYVIDSDGNAVSGAKVVFYPAIYTTSNEGAMLSGSYTRTSDVGISVSSDIYGGFYVDLAEGIYEVEATANGLMDYQGLVSISYGLNETTLMLYQYIETMSDFMCYTTPAISSGVGDEYGYNFIPFTRWNSEDLAGHIGKRITRLKALAAGAVNVRFVVFTESEEGGYEYIYRSDLIAVEDGAIEMVVHDIPTEYQIEIVDGVEYCIGYEVSDYDTELTPAIVSNESTTISGRSDCIVYENEVTDLTTLWGTAFGSWVFGFYVQDESQLSGLNISVGQHDAVASWNPVSYNTFRISYGVEGEEPTVVDNLADCQYELLNLEASTTYSILVEAKVAVGSYVEMLSSSFTTLGQMTTIPMVQLQAYDGYTAGEILKLKTLNTESTDTVEWYVNSEKLTRNSVVLEVGRHKIQCRVTRGSKSYVTTRYINVE